MKKLVKESMINEAQVWDAAKIWNATTANEVFKEFDKLVLQMKRHENFMGKRASNLTILIKYISEYISDLSQLKKEIEKYLLNYKPDEEDE